MSNELDKHFGDQLHAYESEVDAEAIWAAVRPPRRRRPWLWLFLLFGLLISAGAAWWSLTDTNNPGDLVEQAIQEQQTMNVEQVIESDAPWNTDNNHIATATEFTLAETGSTTEGQPEQQISTAENEITGQRIAVTAEVETGLAANITDQSTEVQGDLDTDLTVQMPQVVAQEESTSAQAGLSIEMVSEVVDSEPASAGTTDSEQDEMTEPSADVSQIVTFETSKGRDYAAIGYRLPTLAEQLISNNTLEEQLGTPELYRRGRRSLSPWSVQMDGACMAIRRTLEPDSLTPFISRRVATETVLDAWSTDLTVGYNWHQNWQVRAGLGYTQINTQFSLNETQVRIDTFLGVQTIVFNPNGTADTILGPVLQTETIERERRIYNSFRQWELPILVNYETSLGKLSLIAEAGVRLRLSRTWEGQVIVNQEERVEPWEDQDWYRTSIGVGLQAGLHLGYELSQQLQLRAGATVRYTPTDFSTEQVGFKEGYQLGGLQVGLRYQLR
ncbi:MAG: hypothetical protein AAFZ63_24175 [Bacteroidota bacterium]